jgi:hypothetical protein
MTKQIPESRIAINPVVIDDSKRGNPPGWQEVEPEEEDPLKKWKAHPVEKKKTTIKQVDREYTGIEFLNDVIR